MTSYPPKSGNINTLTIRTAAGIALVGSGLVILFWVLYFSGVLAPGEDDHTLAEFEAAFPFADTLLASTLLAAGIGLWRGKRYGIFCLTGSASMALYLGILDLTFYLRQGLYTPLNSDGAIELLINALCIVGGLIGLRFGWRLWGVAS